MATSSIGANVWHSWHFMHKRNDETEEEVPAMHSASLQLAERSLPLADAIQALGKQAE
jgi:hypothetical protein